MALEQLRVNKNDVMLRIFCAFLNKSLDQAETELMLTHLAGQTLTMALNVVFSGAEYRDHFAVLGMGRMAGGEMTFGSDLDLIFLYSGGTDDLFARISQQVRIFLREIASLSPAGVMYEVDTRLRPHGNSGVLITSVNAFEEHHASDRREIWERQILTRCRPVFDPADIAGAAFDRARCSVYREYDAGYLRTEIRDMRLRVEDELGSPRDKFDIKRGFGGIMDIDFITHYYQLAYGHQHAELQEPGTRRILETLNTLGLLAEDVVNELLRSYDFLKQLEASLRVYDMKSIDTIHRQPQGNHVVARAMGYFNADVYADTDSFMQSYRETTGFVRRAFLDILE
ncbi:MAG: hypothetical protein MI673_08690 [Thiotrichales bacterium]|nr:hypothetical protein [Thiotrichales bacterium]